MQLEVAYVKKAYSIWKCIC